ncbi:SCO family protein [Roseomonas sp. PWR1]|uniref:SCO family protein n=1 Tax=Roseomonas nitratireducens TaxID=2820810 RepID=A0ABS4AV07_9PROT|nr:SCO family protein [Neoroseomonas nitratireducens]MBP0464382.1 SCO family protein [Neoroseomonas nitratireducens]
MIRVVRIASLVLALLLGGLWAFAWLGRSPNEPIADAFLRRIAALTGMEMPAPSAGGIQLAQGVALGGPFTLVDHTGRTVTDRDFAGRAVLLYFGYAYCPDVCPTELGTIAAALDAMGPAGERVTPVFITIDPERDTQAALADYVSRFHPRMVGLTGTPEQIAQAARAYRVYYAKVRPRDMGDYLMDHSSFIYFIGPDGRVRSLFRPETTPEAIAGAVAAQLRAL